MKTTSPNRKMVSLCSESIFTWATKTAPKRHEKCRRQGKTFKTICEVGKRPRMPKSSVVFRRGRGRKPPAEAELFQSITTFIRVHPYRNRYLYIYVYICVYIYAPVNIHISYFERLDASLEFEQPKP